MVGRFVEQQHVGRFEQQLAQRHAAALTAGRAGASVILADEDFRLGGRLLSERHPLDDAPASDWVAEAEADGEALPGFVEDDPSTWGNPGRNEKCPCGSGKKFKKCCGAKS